MSAVRLTEGLFYHRVNIFANALKVFVDFIIGDANHCKSVFFQKIRPLSIFLHIIILIVLRTVKFNNKLSLSAVKIRYIFSEHLLP